MAMTSRRLARRWLVGGVERLSFYIVSQSLAGSVGIRKRTRHYLEYIVTRCYIVELVRDSAKRQRWPFVRVIFYRTVVVLKPKRDIGERKKVRPVSSRVYLAQVQHVLLKFNFSDIELSREGPTSFSFFVCGENETRSQMTQRVPSTGFYDNIVEDHNYTMFSMYPPTSNLSDPWQPSKLDNIMVREI